MKNMPVTQCKKFVLETSERARSGKWSGCRWQFMRNPFTCKSLKCPSSMQLTYRVSFNCYLRFSIVSVKCRSCLFYSAADYNLANHLLFYGTPIPKSINNLAFLPIKSDAIGWFQLRFQNIIMWCTHSTIFSNNSKLLEGEYCGDHWFTSSISNFYYFLEAKE